MTDQTHQERVRALEVEIDRLVERRRELVEEIHDGITDIDAEPAVSAHRLGMVDIGGTGN